VFFESAPSADITVGSVYIESFGSIEIIIKMGISPSRSVHRYKVHPGFERIEYGDVVSEETFRDDMMMCILSFQRNICRRRTVGPNPFVAASNLHDKFLQNYRTEASRELNGLLTKSLKYEIDGEVIARYINYIFSLRKYNGNEVRESVLSSDICEGIPYVLYVSLFRFRIAYVA
jgi:hypothetical protein